MKFIYQVEYQLYIFSVVLISLLYSLTSHSLLAKHLLATEISNLFVRYSSVMIALIFSSFFWILNRFTFSFELICLLLGILTYIVQNNQSSIPPPSPFSFIDFVWNLNHIKPCVFKFHIYKMTIPQLVCKHFERLR